MINGKGDVAKSFLHWVGTRKSWRWLSIQVKHMANLLLVLYHITHGQHSFFLQCLYPRHINEKTRQQNVARQKNRLDQSKKYWYPNSSSKEKNRTWTCIFYLCSPQSMEFPDCISDVSGFHKTQDTADGFSCLNHIFNIILLTGEK